MNENNEYKNNGSEEEILSGRVVREYEDEKYKDEYSDDKFIEKIKRVFLKAGKSVVYAALLLFYSLKDPNVPMKAKATIIGALGYFIAPIDIIADCIPVVGFGDDFAAIMAAIGVIAIYITPETREKAKEKTREIFGHVSDDDFIIVDEKIDK